MVALKFTVKKFLIFWYVQTWNYNRFKLPIVGYKTVKMLEKVSCQLKIVHLRLSTGLFSFEVFHGTIRGFYIGLSRGQP